MNIEDVKKWRADLEKYSPLDYKSQNRMMLDWLIDEIERLQEALDIALKDQPEAGDYSKTAANFHDAWSKLWDEKRAREVER